jgi:hypothetical protein
MRYITGIHALNVPCELNTCGDWHPSAFRWENITEADTDSSIFGSYGIEYGKKIPRHNGTHAVANHIRALLDMVAAGNFSAAGGMRDDFICNDEYDEEVFGKAMLLRGQDNWPEIDAFIGKEYMMKWLNYKKEVIRDD